MGKDQELLEAARCGQVSAIDKILCPKSKWTKPLALPLAQLANATLRKGTNPNCQDSNGETPLHLAALNGHKDVVEALLRLQASANIPDAKGCFPLHLAAWRGNADLCRILLTHGPSIAKVDEMNLEGDTALHSAAQYGYTDVVTVLLQCHADARLTNKKNERAFDLAVQYGRLDTVLLFLQLVPRDCCAVSTGGSAGTAGQSPLHLAAKTGHRNVAQALLDAGFNINHRLESGSALHEAADSGRLDVIKLLLERGIDTAIKDQRGRTCLDLLVAQSTQISRDIQLVIRTHIEGDRKRYTALAPNDFESEYDLLPSSRPILDIPRDIDSNSQKSANNRDSIASEDDSVFGKSLTTSNDNLAFQHIEAESLVDQFLASTRCAALTIPSSKHSALLDNKPHRSPETPKKPPRKKPNTVATMVKVDSTENRSATAVHSVNNSSGNGNAELNVSAATVSFDACQQLIDVNKQNSLDCFIGCNNNGAGRTDSSLKSSEQIDNAPHQTDNNNHLESNNINRRDDNIAEQKVQIDDVKNYNVNTNTIRKPAEEATSFAARPPTSLNLDSSRSSNRVNPSSPTSYNQPPTPEHPPPSPMTAVLGIQEKINPTERRRSRDMETFTEMEYLSESVCTKNGAGQTSANGHAAVDCALSAGSGNKPQSVNNKTPEGRVTDVHDEREIFVIDSHQFSGLSHGDSAAVGQRRTKSQLLENVYVHPAAAARHSKRISGLPSEVLNFEPVVERAEEHESPMAALLSMNSSTDENIAKVERQQSLSKRIISTSTCAGSEAVRTGSAEDAEEWAKIEDLITSIGGGLDTDMLVREFDVRMSSVQLPQGCCGVQSVGDWLEALNLSQYENIFVANGFDDMNFMGPNVLGRSDLLEIGITDSEHCQTILEAASKFDPVKSTDAQTLVDWLYSLRLYDYLDSFMTHNMTEMKRIRMLWDVELTSLLDIHMLGHRKRILASLQRTTEGSVEDSDQSSCKVQHQSTGIEEDKQQLTDQPPSPTIDVWETKTETDKRSSRHQPPPEQLINGCRNFTVQYLGSTLVTSLEGTESTKASISKLKNATGNLAKIPSIILSISYTGVKFIDAKSKKVVCEHEIGNIFCACQDGESLNFLAYITRDLISESHYCHVFTVASTQLAREMILTLGEAFEVAYQIALQERSQQSCTASDDFSNVYGTAI